MSDFITRYEEKLLKHLSDVAEERAEQMCINRQMPDNDVHWHRGYIAACRDNAIYITKHLSKETNEE